MCTISKVTLVLNALDRLLLYLSSNDCSKEKRIYTRPVSTPPEYSRETLPLSRAQEFKYKLVRSTQTSQQYPSLLLEYLVVKTHKKLYEQLPQYRIDGHRNIWIVKPGFDARGHNIYLIKDIREILQTGKTVHSAKIVQKYIEQPMLIPKEITPNAPKLTPQKQPSGEKVKFDIRQWVLVTSFQPLVVYCYKSSYLRLSGSSFDLDDIQDLFKHLTNFSIQKSNSKVANVNEDLIMPIDQFTEYVKTTLANGCKNAAKNALFSAFDWQKDMLPKLSRIIIEVMQRGAQVIENRTNCFEMYGFDFIIDDRLNPWLIQVNLSPACCERTDWLKAMLQKMADGLVAILENKIKDLNKPSTEQSERDYYEDYVGTCGWSKIYDQRETRDWKNLEKLGPSTYNPNVGTLPVLEVVGERIRPKQERYFRKWDRMQNASVYIGKIQALIRGKLARKKAQSIRENNAAVVIQQLAKVFLAKTRMIFLRKERASVKLQSVWRMTRAQEQLRLLRLKREDKERWDATVRLQSYRRMVKARILKKELRKNKAALKIQCWWRVVQAQVKMQKRREYLRKVKIIQRFYKLKFREKLKKAQLIQKWYRRCMERRKIIKIAKQTKFAYIVEKASNRVLRRAILKRLVVHSAAVNIQRRMRGLLGRKRCLALSYERARKNLQTLRRRLLVMNAKYLARRVQTMRYKAAKKIQKLARSFLKRRSFIQLLRKRIANRMATRIQRYYRTKVMRLKFLLWRERLHSAIKIQRWFRGVLVRIQQLKIEELRKKKMMESAAGFYKEPKKKKNVKKVIDCLIDRLYNANSSRDGPVGYGLAYTASQSNGFADYMAITSGFRQKTMRMNSIHKRRKSIQNNPYDPSCQMPALELKNGKIKQKRSNPMTAKGKKLSEVESGLSSNTTSPGGERRVKSSMIGEKKQNLPHQHAKVDQLIRKSSEERRLESQPSLPTLQAYSPSCMSPMVAASTIPSPHGQFYLHEEKRLFSKNGFQKEDRGAGIVSPVNERGDSLSSLQRTLNDTDQLFLVKSSSKAIMCQERPTATMKNSKVRSQKKITHYNYQIAFDTYQRQYLKAYQQQRKTMKVTLSSKQISKNMSHQGLRVSKNQFGPREEITVSDQEPQKPNFN